MNVSLSYINFNDIIPLSDEKACETEAKENVKSSCIEKLRKKRNAETWNRKKAFLHKFIITWILPIGVDAQLTLKEFHHFSFRFILNF